MNIEFRPKTPTAQDDYDVLQDGVLIGTFFWNRNKPKVGDKVATVRDLTGRVAICPNESEAVRWLRDEPSLPTVILSLLITLITASDKDTFNKAMDKSTQLLTDMGVIKYASDHEDSQKGTETT